MTTRAPLPAAVILDFDDTLADSFPPRVLALRRCLSEHLRREVLLDEVNVILRSAPYIDEQLRFALGDDPGIPELVQSYRHHYYHPDRAPLEPFAGIRETLEALQQRDTPVALVTSRYRAGADGNPHWSVVNELERMGLAGVFRAIVGFEDTANPKPSPEPFLLCCRQLGCAPGQVIAVGDTVFDMQGARDAGAVSAAALWGTADREALLAEVPDLILHAPHEILAYLK